MQGCLATISPPTTPGSLSIAVDGDNQGFVIDTLHENSISQISVVMTGRLVWNQGSGNFDAGFARSDGFQGVGATGVDPFGFSGTESLFVGFGGNVTLDSTTNMSSGSRVKSIRLGTNQADGVIAGRNGIGILTVGDAISLTVGDGNTQVGEIGDFTVGDGAQGLLTWNSSGTLNVEGKFRVGQGGGGFVNQNDGTIIAGNTGGSGKFVAVGNGAGSDGSFYNLNGGTLVLGGGLSGGQLRELRVGSAASAEFLVGDGVGTADTAVIETRRHIYIGHDGGTGTMTINHDGRIDQVTDGAPMIVGSGGGEGTVSQNGGTVTGEHHLQIGNGAGSNGLYTISAGALIVADDGSGQLRIADNGAIGTLRVEGTASVTAGAELYIGHTDDSGSVGLLEIIGSDASLSVGKLDNALNLDETIYWEADANGVTPLVVRGDVGLSLFVELQHPSEIAAISGGIGDGIALDLDLSAITTNVTLTLIDNQSAEPIQGLFEDPSANNELYEEGEIITGTGYDGIVSISYLGGTGNDVVLNLTQGSADFDLDGDVDGRDFLIWQIGNGAPGGSMQGDANGDGTVNQADLKIWQDQYGDLAAPAGVATGVPEPSGVVLMLGLTFAASSRFGRAIRALGL